MTDTALVEIDDLGDVRRLAAAADPQEQLRPIGLREVVSGPAATSALPGVLGRLGVGEGMAVVVLSDEVPKVAGDRDVIDLVLDSLAVWSPIGQVRLPVATGGALVHADEDTVEAAVARVAELRPAVLVTVGSGTVADIGKVVAQQLDLLHVVVQTAASVNGFADDQSVLLRSGTKRTTPSRWPEAIVIDSDVLAGSPPAMTRAGLGDLLSTFTAAADWRLAAIVGFDPAYSPTAVAVLRSGIDHAVAAAGGLGAGEPAAMQALARSLTRGGLAMGLAGRTSPSSGAEHTISHLLEMHAHATGRDAAAHGAQVGVATVVMARLWARLRDRLRDGLTPSPLDPARMRARVDAAFGELDPAGRVAAECWSAYERKLSWVNSHLPQLAEVAETWSRYDAEVAALLADPATLAAALRSAGAPVEFADLDPSPGPDIARWAVANCHLMRDRFTIVDLAELTGAWTDDDVDEVLG